MYASLRPLGIGEILDRAVTLSVRYFVPLALIWAVYAVPFVVLAYFLGGDSVKFLNSMIETISKSNGATDPNAIAKQLSANQPSSVWLPAYIAFAIFTYPLVKGALLRAVSAIYLNKEVIGFRAAFQGAFAQWLQLILLTLLWIAFGILAYIGIVLIGIVVGVVFGLLIYVTKVFGVAVAVIAGIIALAGLIAIVAVACVAFYVSYVTQVVENAGFIRSFSLALTRVAGRTTRRSLLFGLAFIAVEIGLSVIGFAASAVSYGLLRSNLLGVILGGALSLLTAIFLAAMMTIYYYDTRVRTEGLDLQLEAQADAATVPA